MPWSMPASLHGPWRWSSLPNWVTCCGKGPGPTRKRGDFDMLEMQICGDFKVVHPEIWILTIWYVTSITNQKVGIWHDFADACAGDFVNIGIIYCHEKWRFDIGHRDSTSKTQGLYRQTIGIQPWKDWDFYHPEIGIQPWKHNPKIEIRPFSNTESSERKNIKQLELNMIQPTNILETFGKIKGPRPTQSLFAIFSLARVFGTLLRNTWHHYASLLVWKDGACWMSRKISWRPTWVPFANLGMVNCFCFLLGLSLWF
jgi:hypothetical protein